MNGCLRAVCILLLLNSCCYLRPHISIQTQYLNRENLASYRIGTPDPQLAFPLTGQRLIIDWTLPKSYFACSNPLLRLTIRFGNLTETVEMIPLCQRIGVYVYEIKDCDFLQKKGIATYKVEVIVDGEAVEEWRHQLWVPLITIGNEPVV